MGGEDLSTCCNESQYAFIGLYVGFLLLCWLTWKTSFMKPMRLIAVFLHEISHAIACWITCGDVHKIEVYNNEGGVTHYVGGCRCLIIPAGYLGCSLWGMLFVVLSGGRRTATGAAAVFVAFLFISLCHSPNKVMVYLNLGWALVTMAFVYVEWYHFSPILNYVILLYGVFIGTFAIFDIYDDLCRRTVVGSDAYACYEIMPCCLPKWVGLQWAIWALFFQIFGIWCALVLMSDECEDESWGGCVQQNVLSFGGLFGD